MKSRTTRGFRDAFRGLPAEVQTTARRVFRAWLKQPNKPSLRFKRIEGTREPVLSVRVGIHWRALALKREEAVVWFWIGSHSDYDRLVRSL